MKTTEINQTELNELMQLYFTTVGYLFGWRQNQESQMLREKVLDLILTVRGRTGYRKECTRIIQETELLRTVVDCTMLKLGGELVPEENMIYFDMKAECLKRYDVMEPVAFELGRLLESIHKAIVKGAPGAIRLGAALAWLGLDPEATKETAIRHWSVLAHTGDYFAMQALEYAYRRQDDLKGAQKWHTVQEICRDADCQFTLTVPSRYFRTADPAAIDTAQLILAARSRCVEEKKEELPIPMLQYVIESRDDLSVKLRNLYAEPAVYHVLLIQQSRIGHKQYGF